MAIGNAVDGTVTTATGFSVASHTGFSSATNVVDGNLGTTQVAGTGAAATELDSMLLEDGKLVVGSPLMGAGTHLGYRRDIEGKQRPNPPAIGAYDAATLRRKPMVDPSL